MTSGITVVMATARQQDDRCYFASFVMYISGAKFKEHCFNISRDILDWVLHCFSETTYDAIIFVTFSSKTKKDILKQKTPFFYTLKVLSNKQQLFFTS